jgi:hypothetical protein
VVGETLPLVADAVAGGGSGDDIQSLAGNVSSSNTTWRLMWTFFVEGSRHL